MPVHNDGKIHTLPIPAQDQNTNMTISAENNNKEVSDVNPSTHCEQHDLEHDFADIAPYTDKEFRERLESLSREPGFEHAVRYVMPGVDFELFIKELLETRNQQDFQTRIMGGFLLQLEAGTSDGISFDGIENLQDGVCYTYMSNHRDIVLDASFLNLCLLRANRPLSQVAIGNNLLVYQWITDLVKLNRSFVVKRDVKRLEALNAARQLSAYIHYAINTLGESIWIAQRQGRTKDSNDMTQESLIKMLSIAGDGNTAQRLRELNIVPVSISYEYDPNDYLKVREFVLKRRDPDFKKSQRDDLLSMETGLLGYKGHIHFHFGPCIDDSLAKIEHKPDETDAAASRAVTAQACQIIDHSIHLGYKFFPINYIAYDKLEGTNLFADKYTEAEAQEFDKYIQKQLEKVEVENPTADELEFMHDTILSMYANPVRNYLKANKEA